MSSTITQPEVRSSSLPWWTLVVFTVVLASEVIWYPDLASFVSRVMLKQGDAGSEIDYYRYFYVLPGALALEVIVVVAAIVARKRRRHLFAVVWGAWGLDVFLAGLSLWRYFTATAAAERYRGI